MDAPAPPWLGLLTLPSHPEMYTTITLRGEIDKYW